LLQTNPDIENHGLKSGRAKWSKIKANLKKTAKAKIGFLGKQQQTLKEGSF